MQPLQLMQIVATVSISQFGGKNVWENSNEGNMGNICKSFGNYIMYASCICLLGKIMGDIVLIIN